VSSPLQRFLDHRRLVVLDGGLATALEARGQRLDAELWSARLLIDAPDEIAAVHTAYLAAGADCVSTATYQATLPGFARLGIPRREGERLLRRAVELAVEATRAFWSNPASRFDRLEPIVAASVGPYGAFLADGSEYDGGYGREPGGVGREALAVFHRRRLEVLAASGADILALETLPSFSEVEVLVGLLADVHHPGAWVSFSCRDEAHLWDGTAIEEAVQACRPEAGVVAVGVNCTAPRYVTGLVRRMRGVTDLPILAYPNSGETFDPSSGGWVGPSDVGAWLHLASEWVGAGACGLGGCCRVGPDAIRGIRATEFFEQPEEGRTS
jgi:homocysteine S-methyltransferase